MQDCVKRMRYGNWPYGGPSRVKELLLDPTNIFANVPFDRNDKGELSCCLGEYSRNNDIIVEYCC